MQDVAGHRVLRTAGLGDRARLLLGFADDATVVLKVAATDDPRTPAEILALARGAGDHVVELRDVAADERETVLVLERLGRGTLAELLERRGSLGAGEAVTILAPVATTLDRLHAAGVAHGALSLGSVGFRDDGAPVLLGFGSAELFPPGAPEVVRETVPGVLADRAALRDLVGLVLARIGGERAGAARRAGAALAEADPAAIADLLFGLAAPAAVRFDADTESAGATRVGAPVEPPVEAEATPRAALPVWLVALLPDSVRDPVIAALERVRDVWRGWPPGRRRLMLGGAAGALTVVLAVAVLPPSGSSTAGPDAGEPVLETAAPEEAVPPLPEDPVEAAVLLLAERERCLRDLSVLCLDAVVQPGSAAQEEDLALVRSVQEGGEYPEETIVTGEPVLVERLGDSALLDLPEGSEPASVLLLRTGEGWRIRDYLAGAPALTG